MSKLKSITTIITLLVMFGYIFYKIGKVQLAKYLLKHDPRRARAVIIDDRNYWGNSPVSHTWSYSYRFYINGKAFDNDSQDPQLQIGDSIDIQYVKDWPIFNRPIQK
ncbi:hypothetical protein [Chitinophaga eiseniae]|uniref:DUF3592 domain-containing protein n=1 Tax=Chitinophaga eiseniae TaxID=634771 RepID=A0A847SPD0_9BACT|nr:hypothetical protein [Chitinophaga eiseniae]NLR79728.1 hypothetical protein [Chitinophaga eiseniae]